MIGIETSFPKKNIYRFIIFIIDNNYAGKENIRWKLSIHGFGNYHGKKSQMDDPWQMESAVDLRL